MSDPVDAVYLLREGWDARALFCSLRSLEKYAPWIRKVHLVIPGDVPSWTDGKARLAAVRQEDLLRERNMPATPDSEALTWRLFRIPGLARRFLFMNEIYILGRPLANSDFLNAKGGQLVFLEENNIEAGSPGANAEQLLNSRFGNKSPRKKTAHMPRLIDSSFLEEVNRIWEVPIRRGGVSMEALYSYYLLECPQQFGAHEKAQGSSVAFDGKTGWGRAIGFLFARPKFFYLKPGPVSAAVRTILKLFYFRSSSFES